MIIYKFIFIFVCKILDKLELFFVYIQGLKLSISLLTITIVFFIKL